MERLYVVENGRAAAGEPKMARALSAYNKHTAREMKAGKTMEQAAASWQKNHASEAKLRAEGRWTKARATDLWRTGRGGWNHNPPGEILGMQIPAFIQDVNPLDGKNLKNLAALTGAAIVVVGAPMFAGRFNHGWAGLGLTALAAGAATGVAFLLSPAIAVPVGITGLALLGLRAAIWVFPRVVGFVVNPLLGWAGAQPPASSAASSAAAKSGAQSGYVNRYQKGLPAGFQRKELTHNPMMQATASGQPAGAAESFRSDRASF